MHILYQIVVQCIFVAFLDCKLDSLVAPKALEGIEAVERHGVVRPNVWVRRNDFSKALEEQLISNVSQTRRRKQPTMLFSSAKSTSCSSIAPNMTWKECSRFWKMVTFHCFRSEFEKPLVWINRICFRTVDLPDSPAPVAVSASINLPLKALAHQAVAA